MPLKKQWLLTLRRWLDDEAGLENLDPKNQDRVDWLRVLPFVTLHLLCLTVFWVGWSWTAAWTALGLYVVRMLAITGVYHRYFSHRCYRTSRICQFILAWIATSSAQKGPLWWASHHRHHHRFADQVEDIHSPVQKGFWYSHVLWILTPKYFATEKDLVKDWLKFPELVFLNRYSILPVATLVALLWVTGAILGRVVPGTQTSGLQMVIWGFCISTVVLFHATASINSVVHLVGSRRYNTPDQSRNNAFCALITLGEGWHNNHHHYPISSRQGFYWWELDVTYYVLVLLSCLGIIHDLVPLPLKKRESNRIAATPTADQTESNP